MVVLNCRITNTDAQVIKKCVLSDESQLYKTYGGYHTGVDLRATSIYSQFDGLVIWIGHVDTFYNIVVQSGSSTCLNYAHVSECSVTKGQSVNAGTKLGTCAKYVHVELLTVDQSNFPFRVGGVTWYKHDVTPMLYYGYDSLGTLNQFSNMHITETSEETADLDPTVGGSTQNYNQLRTAIFIGDTLVSKMRSCVSDSVSKWFTKMPVAASVPSGSAVLNFARQQDILQSSPSTVAKSINDFAASLKSKSCVVYFIGAGPVDESRADKFTNAKIQNFNNKVLESLSSEVSYLDLYAAIASSYQTTDGYTYTDNTLKKIYSIVTAAVGVKCQILDVTPDDFTPYIATFSRSSPSDFAYGSLRENKVCGALVESGFLYNAISHNPVSSFDNPKLASQIAELKKQDLPYGLYFSGRATTVQEAINETYKFSFSVRKYVPQLGVWILLDLTKSKTVNDKIMEEYQKRLVRLGFNGKMGIIATRDMLKKISWNILQNSWLLWLVDHISNLNDLDGIKDPTFFDL